MPTFSISSLSRGLALTATLTFDIFLLVVGVLEKVSSVTVELTDDELEFKLKAQVFLK